MRRLMFVVLVLLLVASASFGQVVLQGQITNDMTLVNTETYLLRGGVFIGDDVNTTTLTIEPGTVIYGESSTYGMLVIRRNSRIIADGTSAAPIVMTSDQPEGSRSRGDWGGLIINGRSQLNVTGGEAEGEGGTGTFGGGLAPVLDDDSGILRYVRVEYAGREISPDNELNGIAFQAVGSGTIVDYIQVHMNLDDGVEFFGGTVDVKHVYVTGAADDQFDWTWGWQGRAQHVILHQYTDDGDRGIEADNNSGDNAATPRSHPIISNITIQGAWNNQAGRSRQGTLLREGTAARIENAIIINFGDCGTDIDHTETFNNAWGGSALNGNLVLDHSIYNDNLANGNDDNEAGMPFTSPDFVATLNANNRSVDPLLTDPYNQANPNFLPIAGSPALTGNLDPNTIDPWFDSVSHVGGMAAGDNWLADWTIGSSSSDPGVTLTYSLAANRFELVGAYLTPINAAAPDVFSSLETMLIALQDNGDVYAPGLGVNTMGNIEVAEGIRVFIDTATDDWTYTGLSIDHEATPYDLAGGRWNWIGQPFQTSIDARVALRNLVEVDTMFVIIQDDNGNIWSPGDGVRTLTNLTPGDGYQIFATADTSFYYNDIVWAPGKNNGNNNEITEAMATPDAPASTGMPYFVKVNVDDALLNNGAAAVEVLDGDLLVGKSYISAQHGFAPVVTWGGSEEHGIEGYTVGNNISVRVLNAQGEEIAATQENAGLFYESYSSKINMIAADEVSQGPAVPAEFAVKNGFPNPFNPAITIPFSLPEAGTVSFKAFNVLGQQVAVQNVHFQAGTHSLSFNGANLVSGVYFMQVEFNGQISRQKVQLIK